MHLFGKNYHKGLCETKKERPTILVWRGPKYDRYKDVQRTGTEYHRVAMRSWEVPIPFASVKVWYSHSLCTH